MTMRTWYVLAICTLLTGVISGSDKPFGLPATPIIEGKVPTRLTQNHFRQGPLAAPQLLPAAILDPKPRHGPETAGISLADALAGLELLSPIRLVAASALSAEAVSTARVAFETAERHNRACEPAQAGNWYQAVIRFAPGSFFALVSAKRLASLPLHRSGLTESREPPLAGR
jgi:hypothetical protein